MEAPPVQYATTSDGVSIAWAEAGHGPAMLFCAQTPFSHVQEQFTVYGDAWEAFARSFRFITFDARGTGMSERDVTSVSAETLLVDAVAVLDAANVDRVVVNADGSSILATSTAVRLAITFPERVSHVILEAPVENTRQLADTPFGRTNLALAELDWTVYTQTLFRVLQGLSSSEMIESSAAAAIRWVDPAVGVRYVREWEAVDLGELLPRVRQPTLVTRNEGFFVPARICQRVAAKIPGAQFRQYADPTYAQMAQIISAFIGYPAAPITRDSAVASPLRAAGNAVILFTDIAGSTALTEQMGDAAFRAASRALDERLRAAIRDAGGTPVEGKVMGDGVMAVFTSAREAIDAALRCNALASSGADSKLRLHIGIHAGDVIREPDNVYGGAVNIAARICDASAPGEVLVSDVVRGMARTSAGVTFEDRGEREMKGVGHPVRLYEVRRD
jgi:class 3 adenylate cyclase/pimeloyl-ACP methyl ester carboxylesterase